jgi:hypothetical protein
MSTCAECSDLLLDYVYGLLDEPAAQGLQAHLAGCAACQEALATARVQQNLLSRAALKIADVPPFALPEGTEEPCTKPLFSHFPPSSPEPTAVTPDRPTPAMRRRPWASRLALGAAAAVIFGLGTLYVLYQQGLADHRKAVAEARREVELVDARLTNLGDEFKKEKNSLSTTVEGQFLHVQVVGPATYQGSAATSFRLLTQTADGQPVPSSVSVRLVARAPEQGVEQVLFHDDFDCPGEQRFVLPATLPVTAAMKPRLVVEVRSRSAKEVIDQPLGVEAPTFLTHLYLNKSTYRIGEVAFFRTVTLDRFALTPVDKVVNLQYALCQVSGQKLELRKRLEGATQAGGIGGGEFALTDDLAEGDYLLIASACTSCATTNLDCSRIVTLTSRARRSTCSTRVAGSKTCR